MGLLADPAMTEYGVKGAHYNGIGAFFVRGWFFGHSLHQLWEQFLAAAVDHLLDGRWHLLHLPLR